MKLKNLAVALPHWRRLWRLFDRNFYLRKYPDVAAAGVNPFRHYIEHGAIEGRKPHALFDHNYYILSCPEASSSSEPSIFHFLRSAAPACNPHPLFDCASYLQAHPDAAKQRMNPLRHYVLSQRAAHKPLSAPVDSSERRLEVVCFEIMDVRLTVAFSAFDCGLGRDVARVWEDSSGEMQFEAPPQQRPFFAAMKYDQLRAQAGGPSKRATQ